MLITKSKYVNFCKCPRLFFLDATNCKEKAELDDNALRLINNGNIVGRLALNKYPGGILIKNDDKVDVLKQVEKTKEAIHSNSKYVYEASFLYDNLFCAVDILKVNDDGSLEIIEVKSSSTGNDDEPKEISDDHHNDVSFQYYVLTKCGYKVKRCTLLRINSKYIYHDKLNLDEYFNETTVSPLNNVEDNLNKIKVLLKEPTLVASSDCSGCPYFQHCYKDFPEFNVWNLIGSTKAADCINNGIITFEDYRNSGLKIGKRQALYLDSYTTPDKLIVNKNELKAFLNKIKEPIYHLDFETTQDIIPFINGTNPYYRRPIQYSLHKQNHKLDVPSAEKYIQSVPGNNLDEIAQKLIKDLGTEGTILMYTSVEKQIIEDLAKRLPKRRDALLKISERFLDLAEPFKKMYVYSPKLGKKYTIKYVLPALCPMYKDEYHNLHLVHNGTEAMLYFEKLLNPSTTNKDEIKEALYKYCEQDTLSMVEILDRLYELI